MQYEIKKIMYIFNDGSFGGATQSLLDTLKEIKKEINPVVVMQEGINIKSSFEGLDIPCYEIRFLPDYVKIGGISGQKKEADFKQSYEAALQLLPIIKKENIQLIHINSSVSYFAAIAALMAKIPYVWHIRELMEEQFGCEFINDELKQELYAQAERLISISDYVNLKYNEKYFMDTVKMYNGIDIEKYKINIDEYREFENIFLVAAVIIPEKGQFDAVRATEILVRNGYSDIRLIIAGADGGNYVWALNKYIKSRKLDKNITVLPFQSDLSKLRREASYAITCSQNEALGRVTIEAMLAGNVLIGARSGGTTEIIGENEDRGFLYEVHNSDALANAMLRAIQCPKEIKRQIVRKAQIYAENTFGLKQYCKKLTDIYSSVISTFQPKNQDKFLLDLKDHYEQVKNISLCESQNIKNLLLKSETSFSLAVKWLEIKQKGCSLVEYFTRNHFCSVAIYGMAVLGCRLYDELENAGMEIKYLLDRNPGGMEKILNFVSLNESKLVVDVIVVTVAAAEKQVVKEIQMSGYENVVGLSDILNDFENW